MVALLNPCLVRVHLRGKVLLEIYRLILSEVPEVGELRKPFEPIQCGGDGVDALLTVAPSLLHVLKIIPLDTFVFRVMLLHDVPLGLEVTLHGETR